MNTIKQFRQRLFWSYVAFMLGCVSFLTGSSVSLTLGASEAVQLAKYTQIAETDVRKVQETEEQEQLRKKTRKVNADPVFVTLVIQPVYTWNAATDLEYQTGSLEYLAVWQDHVVIPIGNTPPPLV